MNNASYEAVMENIQLSKVIRVTVPEETQELFPSMPDTEIEPKVKRYTVLTVLKHRTILLASIVLWIAW